MKSFLSFLLVFLAACLGAQEPSKLKLTKTIPLPGVKGRFDHFAFDPNGHRLFVAALGNDTLEVIDRVEGKRLKTLGGLRKPTGVLYLARSNLIAVANGEDGTLKVFNGASYELTKTLSGLDDADNLRYDATQAVIYLGYGAGALAVIDATTLQQTGSIKLSAHPESFQLEAGGSRAFVNLPDAKQVSVVDVEKRTVTATWPTERFRSNFPMALDEDSHRLFVGCRLPARLLVLDSSTGMSIANLEISGDADDLFYDVKLKRLYISCGEGFVDVIEQQTPDHYRRLERIPTRLGARTSFFSSSTGELFVAVPKKGTEAAELRVYQVQP